MIRTLAVFAVLVVSATAFGAFNDDIIESQLLIEGNSYSDSSVSGLLSQIRNGTSDNKIYENLLRYAPYSVQVQNKILNMLLSEETNLNIINLPVIMTPFIRAKGGVFLTEKTILFKLESLLKKGLKEDVAVPLADLILRYNPSNSVAPAMLKNLASHGKSARARVGAAVVLTNSKEVYTIRFGQDELFDLARDPESLTEILLQIKNGQYNIAVAPIHVLNSILKRVTEDGDKRMILNAIDKRNAMLLNALTCKSEMSF